MITKIIKNYNVFILCYSLFFISLFLDDIAFINFDCNNIIKIMKMLVVLFSTCLFLKQSWKKEDFLKIVINISFGVLFLLLSGDYFLLLIIMTSFASKSIDEKRIFRTSLILIIALSLIVIISCLFGFIPDVYSYRTDFSTFARHSLGFRYNATLPLCIFYISTYYVMLEKNIKSKNIVLSILLILSIVLFIFCDSRNALYLCLLVTLFNLLEPLLSDKKIVMKLLNFITKHIVTICIALSILPGLLRYYGIFSNFWYLFDTIFTNRSLLLSSAINTYGIHVFNNMNYSEFTSKIVYVDSYKWHGIILDSAYAYMLIRYGIIYLIFFWFIFKSVYKKYLGNYSAYIIIILIAIANAIDNDLLSYGALPFMLIGIRSLWTSKKEL